MLVGELKVNLVHTEASRNTVSPVRSTLALTKVGLVVSTAAHRLREHTVDHRQGSRHMVNRPPDSRRTVSRPMRPRSTVTLVRVDPVAHHASPILG